MSKGLEALEDIKNIKIGSHYKKGTADLIIDKVKDLYYHDVVIIEKELKALEIIKNKDFPLCYVKSHTWEQYRDSCFSKEKNALTQEEYDLLKEVLLCVKN